MAITVQETDIYKDSIHKLFPRGSYWDEQFKNPESDCSLFCEAKANFILQIREQMSVLQKESNITTAEKTLSDWERVLLDGTVFGNEIEQRRQALNTAKYCNINTDIIKEIGKIYDITITNITFPFFPGLFGHSHFGIDQIGNLATLSCLFIYASVSNEEKKEAFEKHVKETVLSNYIVYFIYGGV